MSEGSPVSPVFKTPEELIEWLTTVGHHRRKEPYSREAAEAFVHGSGWTVSGMIRDGETVRDIETAKFQKKRGKS